MTISFTEAATRRRRRTRIDRLAAGQAGVVSRRQLYGAGITRWMVRAEVAGLRWRRVGRHCLAMHRGPLDPRARFWAAVLSGGPRAQLDGATSLQWAGLQGFSQPTMRVTVPRGARVWRTDEVDVRQTRRWSREDLADDTIPRTRNEVAAVRGALWARSNKEAALLLSMVVQQGLVTPERLGDAMLRIRRDRRRAFLQGVIVDLLGGVGSLAELDVARECRRRGLPEPDRQVLRRGRHGRYYLDVYWQRYHVVLEVDGIQHTWVQNVVADALRHNDIALQRDIVLRLPVLGLRLQPDAFFAQVRAALVDGGWRAERSA